MSREPATNNDTATAKIRVDGLTIEKEDFLYFDPRIKKFAQTAQSDLRLALEQISKEIPREEQDEVRRNFLVFLSRKSLDPLPVVLAEFRDPELKQMTLATIAVELGASERDANEVLQFAKANLGPEDRDKLLSNFITRRMGRSYEAAAALINDMPSSHSRLATISVLAENWGRSALEPALSWAKSLPEQDRNRALATLAPRIAKQMGLEGITQAMSSVTSQAAKSSCVNEASKLLQNEDAGAAVRWLQSLPNQDQRDAVSLVLSKVPRDAMDEVAQYASQLPDRRARQSAVSAVASRMAGDDPRAAAAWAVQLPDDVKVNGLRSLVSKWYDSDSHGVFQWINSLPRGRDRDIALSGLAELVSSTNKTTAGELLNQIDDPQIKATVRP